MTQAEHITKLQAQIFQLVEENNNLKKEQKEFQDVLILKVRAIQKLGWWKRITSYGKLVADLINTIIQTVEEVKKDPIT